jgi:hypothetical protein
MFVKLDMDPAGHLGPVVGGDHIGMEIFDDLAQGLHDTLDINHHCFHRSGGQGDLLLDETRRHRNAAPHQDFIAGAANPGQVDPLGSGFSGQFKHVRFLGGNTEGLGQQGFMAVDGDVDLVGFENPQVHNGAAGNRGAEHDIGQFGGKHRRTPAVGERAAGGLEHDIFIILIHPHVGAVHHFHHFPVNAPGEDVQFFPDSLALFGGPLGHGKRGVVLLAEFGQGFFPQLESDFVDLAIFGGDAKNGGQGFELGHILDLVGSLAFGGFNEAADHLPGVIGVGG